MVASSASVGTVGRSNPEVGLADAVQQSAGVVVAAVCSGSGSGSRSREEWLAVVGACQSLLNTVTAVQDVALAEVARREQVWCEDGTVGEVVHGHGRLSLDAADLAAPGLAASHGQAQHRVELAVRLAGGRVPVEVEDREAPAPSGLHGIHRAMLGGCLDGYRAGVLARELELAPPEVADAVVAAVSGHLSDDAPTLRRRVRRALARISPDLLRQRAQRARTSTGLRRWVAEPGVDEWHGTFPSEDAATAWAALDRLAHDLVAEGICTSIEQARGKALTDLVTGNATVEVQVVLTVPADVEPETGRGRPDAAQADSPANRAAATVGEWDTTGLAAAAVGEAERPSAPVSDAGERGEDLVQVQGARPSEPLLVRRAWLTHHLAKSPRRQRRRGEPRRSAPGFAPCDPLTGARLDPRGELATDAYSPGGELAALVRARDGRCRFPGCSIAARFCDLDHVRPWPIGRTTARNLLTLCRRHHRIKQAPGWRVRLHPDGTTTWTDPTGRQRTTVPRNALDAVVLAPLHPVTGTDPTRSASAPDPSESALAASVTAAKDQALTDTPASGTTLGEGAPSGSTASGDPPLPTTTWSALESHLGVRLEHLPTHRCCTSAAQLRAAGWHRPAVAPVHDPPPF